MLVSILHYAGWTDGASLMNEYDNLMQQKWEQGYEKGFALGVKKGRREALIGQIIGIVLGFGVLIFLYMHR